MGAERGQIKKYCAACGSLLIVLATYAYCLGCDCDIPLDPPGGDYTKTTSVNLDGLTSTITGSIISSSTTVTQPPEV